MGMVIGTIRKEHRGHESRARSRSRLRASAGGPYVEAKVEFGQKLSDRDLVFDHPHRQTDSTTQRGGSNRSARPHWLQGEPHRVSRKSIRYGKKRNTRSVTNELTTDSYLVPPQYPTKRSITIALSLGETIGIALDIASTATTTSRPTVCGLSLFQSQPLSIVRTNTAPSTDSLPHTPTPPPNASEHHTIYRTPPRAKILTASLFDAYATKFLQINVESGRRL